VDTGAVLAQAPEGAAASGEAAGPPAERNLVARVTGTLQMEGNNLYIYYEEKEEREYVVRADAQLRVEDNQRVLAGDQLTEGVVNPQDLLRILGREAVQSYIVDEVQQVYQSQGVNINDKHIETIVRQMLRKVRVDAPGDTGLLPGELVDNFTYEEINAKVLAEGGEPATAETVLLGVTKASLNAESFLAAASFQETTRVLTEAAINGAIDRLQGLKENVIIGKLIPAQGMRAEDFPALPAFMDDGFFPPVSDLVLPGEPSASLDEVDDEDDDEDDDDIGSGDDGNEEGGF